VARLLENLEAHAKALFLGGGVQEGADRLNRVPALADDFREVGLGSREVEDGFIAVFRARDHDLVGKFDEFPDNVAKEFLHGAGGPKDAVKRRLRPSCGLC